MRKFKVIDGLLVDDLQREIELKDAYIKYLESRLQKYNKGVRK